MVRKRVLRNFQLALLFAVCGAQIAGAAGSQLPYAGVNIAGGAFGADRLPGKYGTDYLYPQQSTIDYFAGKGMNIIRLPLLWERLQHRLDDELDDNELKRIDVLITYARAKNMKVILDIHNYAAYNGVVIGSKTVPTGALGDLWRRLGDRYKDYDTVIFGLMNEPTGLPTETWLEAANIAIGEIRGAGAKNLILVPGNGWSSARDWLGNHYGTPNSEVMLEVNDPAENFSYDVHQYFDADFSGTKPECQSVDIGVTTLSAVTKWAREHGRTLFLGEFGVGANDLCLAALEEMMDFLNSNEDVWLGWTYWAAGEWWPADYFTSLQPEGGKDRPQISILQRYLPGGARR